MIIKEKVMDIYTLHKNGIKKNSIAKKLGINWRTVNKYIDNGYQHKKYDTSNRKSVLDEYIPTIENWLKEDSYTAVWIYDRIKILGYKGGYDQVRRKVRKIKEHNTKKAYLRFETEPGRQAQVDFGEFKVSDEFSKKDLTVYLFAMILGYSRKTYYEFIGKRDMTSFLECHIHAFGYFGGVPAEILYDRMKNVLIREFAGKLEWNKEFYSFCLHYRFKPVVAPPYAAWVKGKVERPFKYVRENFWRGYNYRGIETANRDIVEWSSRIENRIHGTTHERIEDRFERERRFLGELPEHPYDTSEKAFRKVHKDCTVSYKGNIYVLPHRSVGELVLLKIKNGILSAYLDEELLVAYTIPDAKGHFVEDKRFYQALKEDKEQIRRKYQHTRMKNGKGKAKRTLGITGGVSGTITVDIRPIEDYMRIAEV